MTHFAKYFPALFGAALLAACSEPEAFYTAVYPVARVEAQIEIAVPAADSDDETPAADPLEETLRAELLAVAPMEAGGSYTLRFTQYNGGKLEVIPAPGAAARTGSFLKNPGTNSLRLVYGDALFAYDLDTYQADGASCAVLTLDLTAEFQNRYPEAGIARAVRREYTTYSY
ncbi:MAG: hypothetical protein K2O55_01330 [Alistipes sp.]|nr:hypothetical protein [Alistipes sp.]